MFNPKAGQIKCLAFLLKSHFYLHIPKILCNFAMQNKKIRKSMSKDSFIKYKSAEERAAAIRGMLNLKNEWLDYVQRCEAELGIR